MTRRDLRGGVATLVEDPDRHPAPVDLEQELGRDRLPRVGRRRRGRVALGELGVAERLLEPRRGVRRLVERAGAEDPRGGAGSSSGPLRPGTRQRAVHPRDRPAAVLRRDDDLGEHRVVVGGDLPARPDARVDPDERARRLPVRGDAPGPGRKLRAGSSALIRHWIAWPVGRTSAQVELLAERDADLGATRSSRSPSRSRCARPAAGCSSRGSRSCRPRRRCTRRCRRSRSRPPCERHRCLADPRAQVGVDRGRRRLLDQLLVAALDRAVAFAQEEHVAPACRRAPAPRRGARGRCTARGTPRGGRSTPAPRGSRARARSRAPRACARRCIPLPPPPNAALTMTREADAVRRRRRLGRASTGSGVPGTIGTPTRSAIAPGRGLVAHHLDRLGGRADERQARVGDRARRSARVSDRNP